MPELNALWAKYGCTKCNNYKLLVLEVDISDSKTKFINEYVNKHGVKCPAVAKGDGAEQLCKAVEHEGAGAAGPDYLITPDKKFKMFPKTAEINAAGGNAQHVCNTCVLANACRNDGCGIALRPLRTGELTVSVSNAGIYTLSAYSVDGRRIAHNRTRIETGGTTVSVGTASRPSRLMIISVTGAATGTVQTVLGHD